VSKVAKNEGERISFMGMDLIWKITAESSGGSLISFIQIAPPGTGVPLHSHHTEDEFILVESGALRFRLADESFDVAPGDVVLMPKGVPHAFMAVGDEPARVLFTLTLSPDSDYETMFNGLVGLGPGDFEAIQEVCAANNLEFYFPPEMPS